MSLLSWFYTFLLLLHTTKSLISHVKPSSYSLLFTLYPESQYFTGNADVKFDLLSQSSEIVINSKDLSFIRLILYEGASRVYVRTSFEQNDSEEVRITKSDGTVFPETVYLLRIQYRAELKRTLSGIYLTEYTTEDGVVHPIVATHFEPTHARKAFPCFDEPQLKAQFSIKIDHLSKYKVVSNMPKLGDRYGRSDTIRTEFQPTPAMSTYLVAFVLSELEEISTHTSRGVLINVHNRPGKSGAAQTGLETIKQSVEFFENYLGRVFPLPKLDIVPLPDFGIGGMENWGLITIREDLFYSDNTTTLNNVILTRAILAHEVAHMWFGDLVSIESWNNLWLKEGAANMLMIPAIENIVTKGRTATISDVRNSLTALSRFPALEYDSGLNTHPISMNISDPGEAAAAFDAISYSKSAALLNMLKSVIGEDRFRLGIGRYVRSYQYGSASLQDFLNKMDTTGSVYQDTKISSFMEAWLTQSGYPVISVTKLRDRKYRLRQERFVNKPNYSNRRITQKKWPIMITLQTEKRRVHKFMMTARTQIVSFNYDPGFVKINVNSTMFFRTNYDEESLECILRDLESGHRKHFTEQDRAGLVSDVITVAMVNKCPMRYALRLIRYLKKEESYMVWEQAFGKLSKLSDNLSSETKSLFNGYLQDLLTEAFKMNLTDSVSTQLLSSNLMYYGVLYNVPTAIQVAREEFDAWLKNGSLGITTVVLMYGVVEMGQEQVVWERLMNTPYPDNQAFYKVLSASPVTEVIDKLLEGSLKYDWVPLQNKYDILSTVSNYHPSIALDFLMDNFEKYYELYGDTQFNFSNILHGVIGNLRTREDLQRAHDFFKHKNLGSGKRSYDLAVEEVQGILDWKNCCEGDMRDYLIGLGYHQ